MYAINRQVAVIKPKKPFADWVKSIPEMDETIEAEDLNNDCTVILLPHFDTNKESMGYIKKHFRQIFEIEFDSWHKDKNVWPKKRDYSVFREWFDIEFHSEVLDFGNSEIEKEEY